MASNILCKNCKDPKCIGFYLLHPKEVTSFIPRLKQENLKINPKRGFNLIDSPSSGEVFTTFKELHVLHADDETKEDAICAEVYTKDLQDAIIRKNKEWEKFLEMIRNGESFE